MGCGASSKPYEANKDAGSTPPAAKAAAAPEAKAAEPEKPGSAAPAPAKAEEPKPAAEAAKEAPKVDSAAPAPKEEAAAAPERQASAEEEEEEDDDLEMDEAEFEASVNRRTCMQMTATATDKRQTCRMAVSSEVLKPSDDWKAPTYEKTQDQEERLTKSLSASFMFSALSGDALKVVVKAFQEMKISAGTTVITEGEEVLGEGPALYVLETGKLSVYKKAVETSVFQYTKAGEYFGELALLYNAPRAATVKADEDSTVWCLDRATFTYLVKDAARMASRNRIEFLEKVPILKGLDAEEKAKLADVMNATIVPKGDYIIKQGAAGDAFYILESGKLEALKDGQKVLEYQEKDYFGELALLKNAPRAADVVATEMSKVLSLDVASFKRIVGSLEDVMKERAASYEGVSVP